MQELNRFADMPDVTNEIKACCANAYAGPLAELVLGDSYHPGGLELTERLGDLLGLAPGQRVLDLASGPGTSAIFLAERFGCEVVGVDYSADAVAKATQRTAEIGMAKVISFKQGDAEELPFPDESFDAVVCECAFCTFPDKDTAAAEISRVIKPGGFLGLSDLTRDGPLPDGLDGLLAWIACIGDAQPVSTYVALFEETGIVVTRVEDHNQVLARMIDEIRARLVGLQLLVKLKQVELSEFDYRQARSYAAQALESVRAGTLGYALLVGRKSAPSSQPSPSPSPIRPL
jgi:arsenite methyltransferase